MVDLTNFQEFNFKEGVPYISVTNNGITFNRSVVVKMGYPEHVRLLIDSAECLIALQRSEDTSSNAVPFYKERKNGVLSVRWNAKDLINTISRITEWNLKQQSYRVNGDYYPEQGLMLFDLKEATELK